jgi:hypothetical protein
MLCGIASCIHTEFVRVDGELGHSLGNLRCFRWVLGHGPKIRTVAAREGQARQERWWDNQDYGISHGPPLSFHGVRHSFFAHLLFSVQPSGKN